MNFTGLDLFPYIGGLSGAAKAFALAGEKIEMKTAFNGAMADPAVFAKSVHLWMGVGTNEPERVKQAIQRLHTSLEKPKIQHVYYESPGTDHERQTWRRDLQDFAPRLFATRSSHS